jgi:hypothetical protein
VLTVSPVKGLKKLIQWINGELRTPAKPGFICSKI